MNILEYVGITNLEFLNDCFKDNSSKINFTDITKLFLNIFKNFIEQQRKYPNISEKNKNFSGDKIKLEIFSFIISISFGNIQNKCIKLPDGMKNLIIFTPDICTDSSSSSKSDEEYIHDLILKAYQATEAVKVAEASLEIQNMQAELLKFKIDELESELANAQKDLKNANNNNNKDQLQIKVTQLSTNIEANTQNLDKFKTDINKGVSVVNEAKAEALKASNDKAKAMKRLKVTKCNEPEPKKNTGWKIAVGILSVCVILFIIYHVYKITYTQTDTQTRNI
jgi:hypothetical protein